MNPANYPDICTFNVGGDKFSFSRETVRASGINFLSLAISGEWMKNGEVFIDADPKIFRKWIAPYIRHLVLPDLASIKSGQDKQMIVATANSLGLAVILNHVNPPKPTLTKEKQIQLYKQYL